MSIDENKARAFVRALLAAVAEDRDLDAHRAAGGHDDDTLIKMKRVEHYVETASKALCAAIEARRGDF